MTGSMAPLVVGCLSLLLLTSGATHAAQRIVSMNLCTDELVLMLADPAQIKSVTWLVKEPQTSWLAEQARGIAVNHGLSEEIVTLQPDLVVAGTYTTPTTIALLKKLSIPVLRFPLPRSLADIKSQIRTMARAVGQVARGEAVIADMEARLAALPPLPERRTTAVLYQPNGLTAQQGTLVHEVLELAGLENLAVRRSLANYAQLPLEVLLLDRPDLLIMNNYEQSPPSLAQSLLQHPALQKTFTPAETVVVPAQAWSCGTPNVVRAVEILRHAAIRVVTRV